VVEELALLKRKLERERRARQEAEALLEEKSRALYDSNQELREANATLDERVRERTRELSMARDEALAASRAKTEFLANMSHELRTPLNAIIGFSEVLMGEIFGPADPRYPDFAADIHASGRHLLEIINDILDMSKIEAGKLDLHESELDLGEVVDSCDRLIARRGDRSGCGAGYEPPAGAPRTISADPTKLKQVPAQPPVEQREIHTTRRHGDHRPIHV